MSKWVEPIIDRTAADVSERTPKAFFNVADWVRINGNTQQIQAVVNVMLALNIPVAALAQPTLTTIPSVEDINAFIANIERLRAAACLPVATGATPLKTDYKAGNSADAPDYVAVNAWERDLLLIRVCLVQAAEQVLYCGTFGCGSPRILQVSFRAWKGYAPDANDPRRLIRAGAVVGASLTRQNKWRSAINHHQRVTRCGASTIGAGLTLQNGFRRYG
jgi:hypothetical protein